MSFNKDLLEIAGDTAIDSGAREFICKLVKGNDYQIRFSNSEIDVAKEWNRDILEIFLSIGRRIDVLSIQNPTQERIQKMVPMAVANLRKIPRTLLYWGMNKKNQKIPKLDGLFDSNIYQFYEEAPSIINNSIKSSLDAGSSKVAGVLYFGHLTTGVKTSYDNGGVYDNSYYQFTIRSFCDAESSGQQNIVGRNLAHIDQKFETAAIESNKIAKMAVGGQQAVSGKYDLIMSPTVAANIFNSLTDGANPVYIIGQLSALKGKMNKKIGPEELSVSDDATIPEGLASRPFDYEGYPSQKTPLIKNGKLVGLIQNTSSAKLWKLLGRFGSKTTGNSFLGSVVMGDYGPKVLGPLPTNTVYEPGSWSLDEMIAESKRPTIYVTSNWYTRFTNNIEGTFSTIPRDGIFLIENGEIKRPIRKIRIADNLLRMTKDISAIGNDVTQIQWWEVEHPTWIPHIKANDVSITTAVK